MKIIYYNSKEERAFILNIISASANKTSEKIVYSEEIDRIGYKIDVNINIDEMIREASRNLSENIILAKVIQGVPIIGIYG